MRKNIPNLFIVGGDGRNSGKTSMACRIIGQFRDKGIVSVKISPHFHDPSAGLQLLEAGEEYNIFEETDWWSAKDTSRMLQSGAAKVFYSQVTDKTVQLAFERILNQISAGTPVVCESPSLIKYFNPGIFVIMRGSDKPGKETGEIESFSHLSYTIEDLDKTSSLPFLFRNGEWIIK